MALSKRCLVITNGYVLLPSLAHFQRRMEEEFSSLGITCEEKTTADILAFLDSDGALRHERLNHDFALFLDKDPYIGPLLEQSRLRLFNSAAAIGACDDKMATYLKLMNHGIAMPKTISAPLCYAPGNPSDFLPNLKKALSFPFIAKANFGSQGQGVYFIENDDQLEEIEAKLQLQPRLYQEFIAPSKGFDDRLIVIGGKFFCGYRRRSLNGDFRSNIAQGGTGEKHEMTPQQIAIAEKAAKILGLDYCGIDLLDSGDPNKPILCEVNSNAFFAGAEKVTGKNVAKAYAEHIYKTIYGN